MGSFFFPVTSIKFVFASSLLLCIVGWYHVLQRLQNVSFTDQHATNNITCSHQQAQQLQEWKVQSTDATVQIRQLESPPLPSSTTTTTSTRTSKQKRLRVLMGIFTYDAAIQYPYRRQYRKLFEVFAQHDDPRVCSLYDFEHAPSDDIRYQCQFIYTFVVGGLRRESAPTELVDDSSPILMPSSKIETNIRTPDLRVNKDVTFLNIKENMNEGKSQTWFKYATIIMDKYDLDYAGKIDSDSLPYLDKFFKWAHIYLPPPPYNSGILAGVPIDKLWWDRNKRQIQQDSHEDFFKASYGKVMHLYAAGQCYILSRDLAHTVVLEAPKSQSYREGHEDHDISAMAFHSTKPISFHFLSLQQQFWRHPVKRYKKKVRYWRTLWHNENVRMTKILALRQEHLKQEREQLAAAAAAKQQQQQQQQQQQGQQQGQLSSPSDDDNVAPELEAPVQLELDEPPEETEEEEDEEADEETE